MFPMDCQLALKEWSVAIGALSKGDQVLLLRKGGIREEGKHFRVQHPEFLLYPTLEHQREDLLKDGYHDGFLEALSQDRPPDTITFSHWARVEEVIELAEQDKLDAISRHHIWTDDYAQQRLHWKPRHPLLVMLLRIYALEEPRAVPYLPRYGGCKSWVQLSDRAPLGRLTPVLTDQEFRAKVEAIKGDLGLVDGRYSLRSRT